jgi:phage shock protein PspC (stress-responsive transcriptional regulator)
MGTPKRAGGGDGASQPRPGCGSPGFGLGRRGGIAPWPARVLFVLVLLLIPGSQILIYPILWVLRPSESTVTAQAWRAAPAPA